MALHEDGPGKSAGSRTAYVMLNPKTDKRPNALNCVPSSLFKFSSTTSTGLWTWKDESLLKHGHCFKFDLKSNQPSFSFRSLLKFNSEVTIKVLFQYNVKIALARSCTRVYVGYRGKK